MWPFYMIIVIQVCLLSSRSPSCFVFAGEAQEFTITFAPDHEGEGFSDELCISLNGEVTAQLFNILWKIADTSDTSMCFKCLALSRIHI